ncbi:carcinoembryonic antigen-related cell adhesion molecule 21-like [Talpa occidentalis]|uniref:carcinoembryonic antigen-related cell adhesion molecule 21-like n=1 Tax=Talpa occidentalis TaxID=50954 RepID=UPI0018904CCF|nr:carcinoembryonic antigen-related cell adhesion molecule 21-like [Talpa occidentalis]
MEAPSAHGHRGRVPWQGLLLAVALCIFWVPPTNGGFRLKLRNNEGVITPYAIYKLKLKSIPTDVHRFIWSKGDNRKANNIIATHIEKSGKTIPGLAYKPRYITKPKGVLKIKNLTREDAGLYTVKLISLNYVKFTESTHLFILEPLTAASVEDHISRVQENISVDIICLTGERGYSIHWVYNGLNLEPKSNMTLSKDRAVLSMTLTKREDAGNYQCQYKKGSVSGTSTTLKLEVV